MSGAITVTAPSAIALDYMTAGQTKTATTTVGTVLIKLIKDWEKRHEASVSENRG